MEFIEEQTTLLTSIDSISCEVDRKADLIALVHIYSPLLFRVAHSVLRNAAEAEDVVQDTFLRVLQHRCTLAEVRNMRVWLVRIAWNLALDRKRRQRPEQLEQAVADALAAEQMPAEQVLVQTQRLRSVFAEIEKLPTAERRVLLLSAVEELSPIEIAEVLDRSEAAARGLLFRARKHLRERLERKSRHAGTR